MTVSDTRVITTPRGNGEIDREKLTATLDLPLSQMKRIEVQLSMMLGRLAVAPSGDQASDLTRVLRSGRGHDATSRCCPS